VGGGAGCAARRSRPPVAAPRSRRSATWSARWPSRRPFPLRSAVLGELGRAEAALGLREAVDHLAIAADLEPKPEPRARLALLRGRALHAQGRHEEAAAAFDAGVRELTLSDAQAPELYDELQSGFLATGWLVPWLQSQSIKRSAEQRRRALAGPRTHGQRLLLAQAAVHAAFDGEPASQVSELAQRGWENGSLLDQESSEGIGWNLISTSLCLAGELEPAVGVADAALDDARQRGSPLAFATASFVRSRPQLWRGQVTDALADLELARDARRFGWRQFTRSAAAYYCLCLIETGDLDRAEAVLIEDAPLSDPYDLEDAIRLYARAELRLAQGRAEEALEVALEAGNTAEHTVKFLGFCPGAPAPRRPRWRSRTVSTPPAWPPRPPSGRSTRACSTSGSAPGTCSACVRAGSVVLT